MTLEALIFDVDGTLAETEEAHRCAFNAAFATAGLDWAWDAAVYQRLLAVTGGKERIAHYIKDWGGRPVLNEAAIAALHRDKTSRYAALVQHSIALRPGVRRLLDEARRAGVTLAIATTTTPANVNALLRATLGEQGERRFAVIAAGDVVGAKKPAPEIYHLALRDLGLAPGACLAIEDSPAGYAAATAAGIPTLVTLSAYGGMDGFAGALSVLDQLGEINAPSRHVAGRALQGPCVTLAELRGWMDAWAN